MDGGASKTINQKPGQVAVPWPWGEVVQVGLEAVEHPNAVLQPPDFVPCALMVSNPGGGDATGPHTG